jgi:hypothetical protein
MSRVLYFDVKKGINVTAASYSSREVFKFCRRKFLLTRVEGWSSKRIGAAPNFGRAIETAVQYHVQNNFKGGVEKFIDVWNRYRTVKDFEKWEYGKTEGSWENLLQDGIELLKLFALRAKWLPIYDAQIAKKPVFQLPLRKEIFPGTELAGLENTAYLDMVSYVHPLHPLLTPWPQDEIAPAFRVLITDIKTSGKTLRPELVVVDPQLVEYAWQYKQRDVAFLWFVKVTRGFDSGSRVTLLEPAGPWAAGNELFVIQVEKDPVSKSVCGLFLGDEAALNAYDRATKDADGDRLAGNALKEAKTRFYMNSDTVFALPSQVTKQKLQFAAARLSVEDMQEAGKLVGQVTVEMVMAHEQQFYPKEGGIRFPNEKCNLCDMRYICIGDTVGRDEKLTKFGEEWLDGQDVDLDG